MDSAASPTRSDGDDGVVQDEVLLKVKVAVEDRLRRPATLPFPFIRGWRLLKLMTSRKAAPSRARKLSFVPRYPRGRAFDALYRHKTLKNLLYLKNPPLPTSCPKWKTMRLSPNLSIDKLLKGLLGKPHLPADLVLVKEHPEDAPLLLDFFDFNATLAEAGIVAGDRLILDSLFPLPILDFRTGDFFVVKTSIYHTVAHLKFIIEAATRYCPDTLKLSCGRVSFDGKDMLTLQSLGVRSTLYEWVQLSLFPVNRVPPLIDDDGLITPSLLFEKTGSTTKPRINPNITVDHLLKHELSLSDNFYMKLNNIVLEGSSCLSDYGVDNDTTLLLCRYTEPATW